jgi:O-antigen ligase
VSKTINNRSASKQHSPVKWSFYSAGLITLFINPKLADPFNAPKLYLLICGTVILLGFLIFGNKIEVKERSAAIFLVVIFICAMGISVLFTDVKYQALFGDSLRQTGFLAYFGFAVYLLAIYKFFRFDSKKYFYLSIGALGFILTLYGIVQYAGKDPFPWINQYNPIIITLGNPNFTGALLAILATLTFSFIFDKQLISWQRIFFLVLTMGLVSTIYLSNARQGLLSLMVGLGIYLCLKLIKKNKALGSLSFAGLFLVASFAVGGILQKGPLEALLYKDSVSTRGHYWRAGLRMFRENFLTGVGIDSYGSYFRLYKDSNFTLRYGYDLTSNNAHNVPIQLFATGGIFVGLAYLAIILFIIYRFIKGFSKNAGNESNLLCGVFAAWIAFQSQSIVSIDNIGLTIWGWVLGGLIIAMSNTNYLDHQAAVIQSRNKKDKSSTMTVIAPIFTGLSLLLSLILVAKLTQSESLMFKIRGDISNSVRDQNTVISELGSIIDDPFAQPFYKASSADSLYQMGLKPLAIQSMEGILKIDPNNPLYLNVLASMYEDTNAFEKSINLRIKSSKYDPYNVKNYLQLARLYKIIGNQSKALEMKRKINELDPVSEFATIVNTEIV